MDELRGPNIQIVLHVKEGLGFGFLRSPFIVSGSLNGYMLETDPVVPCHAPVFDAELVWEADKRKFRSLRVQNVPIKVEVFTTGTQGRKDKVGYLLMSLLGAQPCPSHKIVDLKQAWHRLLGVKSEGKCCHPQLLLSLSIEDRVNTHTPRNELRMFHHNEVAYLSTAGNPPPTRSMLMTLNEYIAESKKTTSSLNLQPRLLCDDGLIQIGSGRHLFVLSLVIGAVENLDLLLPDQNEEVDCYITYSVFTHTIMTDRVGATSAGSSTCAQFNQRTSLRLRSSLASLGGYFADCPHLVTRICARDRDIGICSIDLRKLVPTEDTDAFVASFCNDDKALTIHERCFILRCDDAASSRDGRRPYVDIEMSLKYAGLQEVAQKPSLLTARSATHLERDWKGVPVEQPDIRYRSGSYTHLDQDVGGVRYTAVGKENTGRYKNASGDSVLQTNEIADLIKKMCDSFAESQERLLASTLRPATSDMQVQCGPQKDSPRDGQGDKVENDTKEVRGDKKKLETSKSDTCITHNHTAADLVKQALSATDRDSIMQRFVEELEDWKERQQELFKCQLKRKEEYHLDLLSEEWQKKRRELEMKLSRGIEQCRNLAADLSRATDEFRLRGFRTSQREKKLQDAKKALEDHYTARYQELREASQKMEDDMNHQLKLKDMRVEELEMKVQHLEKQVEALKDLLKNNEKESENKYSGLTKDQTASLIQELRCLEEKLDSAVQSKAFFKEQWGRAVRELHLIKLSARRQMLTQLQQDRRQLGEMGLDTIQDQDENTTQSQVDLKRLKDDFYVDILANTPALDSHSMISTSGPNDMEMYGDNHKNTPKNPMNDKLSELISQRERLIQQDNPDEDLMKQLNHEIRNMLLNCGT